MMPLNAKIYVAGHRGLVGSALMRALQKSDYSNLVFKTHEELDLTTQDKVRDFFEQEKPEYVFLAAAKVGGIMANNTFPAEFIYQNLQIQNNVIHESYRAGVKKLLLLGSSCIYPRECPQPMKEEYLLTGPLEPTNEPYAIAKIAGIKMCQSYNRQYGTNFIAVMPTNLYGPGDNFDPNNSHLFAAFVKKFTEAAAHGEEKVEIWGTGTPRREFLHVDDMADGCLFLMNNFDPTKEHNERGEIFFNLGTGTDISVRELAELFKRITDFKGELAYNSSKPDGMPQKLQDMSRMHALGWRHTIELEQGIRETCEWYEKKILKK